MVNKWERTPEEENTPSPWAASLWAALVIGILLGGLSLAGHLIEDAKRQARGEATAIGFGRSVHWMDVLSQSGLWLLPVGLGIYAGLKEARAPRLKAHPAQLCMLMSIAALLGAAPMLGEGLLCYLFIVPWHFVVGPMIALVTEAIARPARSKTVNRALAILIFSSAAYASKPNPNPTPERLSDEVVVELPQALVFASIAHLYLPMKDESPLWMRVLLSEPVAIEGGGAEVGAERRIRFSNGVLLARMTQSRAPESFTFEVHVEQAGREFFDHWLTFGRSELRFEALGPARTRIVHVTEYTPHAQPRWYFARSEKMLGHAIQTNLLEAYAQSMEKAQRDAPSDVGATLAVAP